ncbi:MAG: hydrogenase maturation nickel metallochaperone HypA [Bacteroidetes bacterium]|nr:MAG: hydrogenase maturation nickel metallochaperone HypA [Bacteroidota bacterium]
MHELSIVMGIIDLAEQQALAHGAESVQQINLEIGELAGIDWPALEFAWQSATVNTVLENAEYVIDKVPGEAECLECEKRYYVKNLFEPCPHCHQYLMHIVKGKELRVKSLIVN